MQSLSRGTRPCLLQVARCSAVQVTPRRLLPEFRLVSSARLIQTSARLLATPSSAKTISVPKGSKKTPPSKKPTTPSEEPTTPSEKPITPPPTAPDPLSSSPEASAKPTHVLSPPNGMKQASPPPKVIKLPVRAAPARTAPVASAKKAPAIPTRSIPSAAARSYAQQLADLGASTILYEAPSHSWLLGGSMFTAGFLVMYAAFNYVDMVLNAPEGLAWWVQPAFALVTAVSGGFAAFFVLSSVGIIAWIRAVPRTHPSVKAALKRSSAATEGARAAFAAGTSPILIEVATRRLIPFLEPKTRLATLEEVQLPCRVTGMLTQSRAAPTTPRPRRVSVAEQRAEVEQQAELKEYRRQHPVTAPLWIFSHWIRGGFRGAWAGTRRALTREGFLKVHIGEAKYKLDVTGGWVRDNGKALDRLLAIRPNGILKSS